LGILRDFVQYSTTLGGRFHGLNRRSLLETGKILLKPQKRFSNEKNNFTVEYQITLGKKSKTPPAPVLCLGDEQSMLKASEG